MNQPATTEHIASLDGLRGFAVLFVTVFHTLIAGFGSELIWNGWTRDFASLPKTYFPFLPLAMGWSGVAVFFVVSGFCIHWSHSLSQRKELPVFFARRIFRIYPPYLLAFLFFALVFPPTRLHWNHAEAPGQLVSHLFLCHNIKEDFFFGVNGSFWSIAVEFQLYLLYPALLWLARKAGWAKALAITAAVELSLRAAMSFHPLPAWVWASPFYYWLSWSLGAKLADDYLNHRPLFWTGRTFPLWVALTVVSHLLFRPLENFSFLFAALASADALGWLLLHPKAKAPKWFPGATLARVGVLSYSLYLLHQPFILWFGHTLTFLKAPYRMHTLLIFFASLIFCAITVWISGYYYRYVERPSIEMGKRFIARALPPRIPSKISTLA